MSVNNEKTARLVVVSDDEEEDTQLDGEEPATDDDLLAQLPDDTEVLVYFDEHIRR